MKIFLTISMFIIVNSIFGQSDRKETNNQFIEQISEHAKRIQSKYDVPYEVTIAVAALESGFGRAVNARNKRNYLGIMSSKTGGLREFETHYESFEYFGKLLSGTLGNEYLKERYKPLKYCKGYRTYCITLQSVGYSTGSEYANKLINIITQNNLHIN